MAVVAKAGAANYGLYVFDIEVTDANKNDLTKAINNHYSGVKATGVMKYDSQKRKLTLNNFTLVTNKAQRALYYLNSQQDDEIELIGNNKVGAASYALEASGFAWDWILTFSGTGKLVLDRTYTYTNFVMQQYSSAVIKNATLEIQGECKPNLAHLIVNGGIFKADAISKYYNWSYVDLQNNSAVLLPVGATPLDLSTLSTGDPVYIGPETRKDSRISWPYESIRVGRSDNIGTLSNPYNLPINKCSVSKSGIVRITDDFTVTPIGYGTTKVTAYFYGNATYRPATVTMEVTVLSSADVGGWNRVESTVTYNDNPKNISGLPIYTFKNSNKYPIHFESSDPSVATIDSKANITVLKSGETNLSAIYDGDDQYLPNTRTCKLIVKPQTVSLQWRNAKSTYTYGATCDAYIHSTPEGLPVTYDSSTPTVATVDATGKITLKGIGEATITATFDGNEKYAPATSSFTLTVTRLKPNFSWSANYTIGQLGQTFYSPTLSNSDNLPVRYTSSDPAVATIDETGNVTLLALGTTTISAIFDGNEAYSPKTVTYELEVVDFYWAMSDVYLAIGRSFHPEQDNLLVNPSGRELDISISGSKATYDPATGIVTGVSVGYDKIQVSYKGFTFSMNLVVCPVGDAIHSRSLDSYDVRSMIQTITRSSGSTVAPYAPEDVNGDGRLDITDVVLLIELLKQQAQ